MSTGDAREGSFLLVHLCAQSEDVRSVVIPFFPCPPVKLGDVEG